MGMSSEINQQQNPHKTQPVLGAGEPLAKATAAMIMIHGRGAAAQDILGVAAEIEKPGYDFLAPQARQNSWYPYSFLMQLAQSEQRFSSHLDTITGLLVRYA